MPDYPIDYKDQYYSDLTDLAEEEYGLPSGMLHSLYMEGEKSNADATNKLGTKWPWQVTKKTRDAFLEKTGVDAFLSPENGVKIAAQVAKDGLKKYDNNVDLAMAHYGGHDNINNDYVKRTINSFNEGNYNKFKKVYDAYQSGQMSDEESKNFESLVNSGEIQLAPNWKLKESNIAPQSIIDAYNNGSMSDEEKANFDALVADGKFTLPQGVTLGQQTQQNALESKNEQTQATLPDQLQNLATDVTGTPEAPVFDPSLERTVPDLPSVWNMPEMNQMAQMMGPAAGLEGLAPGEDLMKSNEAAMKSLNARFGSLMASPEETMKILKVNFPNVGINKDSQGNYIVTSPSDNKQYVFAPGKIQSGDFERFTLASIPFALTGGAGGGVIGQGLVAAGTQAGMEVGNKLAGGEFNPGQVALAAATPALIKGGEKLVGSMYSKAAQPTNATSLLTEEELLNVIKGVVKGDQNSKEILASQALPDEELKGLFTKLGINEKDIPIDILTQNKNIRELGAYGRSEVGGAEEKKWLNAPEKTGLVPEWSAKVSDTVKKLGATKDLSEFNNIVKADGDSLINGIKEEEKYLYGTLYGDDSLQGQVPGETVAKTDNLFGELDKRMSTRGNDVSQLTKLEKELYSKLSPTVREMPKQSDVVSFASPETEKVVTPKTFDNLRDARQILTEAKYDINSPFYTNDRRILNIYERALMADEKATIASINPDLLETVDKAHSFTKLRKDFEDKQINLFGDKLDKSLTPKIRSMVETSKKGDNQKLKMVIDSIEDPDLKKTAVSSSLLESVSTKGNFDFNKYLDFYKKIQENKEGYKIITDNLGKDSGKILSDLNKFSQNMEKTRLYIETSRKAKGGLTGELKDAKQVTNALFTSIGRILSLGSYKTLNAPVAASSISAALHRSFGENVITQKNVAEFLASDELREMVRKIASGEKMPTQYVRKVAMSNRVGNFFGLELTEKEQNISTFIQSIKNNIGNEDN